MTSATASQTARMNAAIVLSAGLGTRMRPLTLTTPKPLVQVCGKTLIDYALDALAAAGIGRIVVNVHYLADQIVAHVGARPDTDIMISDERAALLDSGGGIVHALPLLGADPFVVLNADTFWLEDEQASPPALERLMDAFDETKHDIAMLLVHPEDATGYDGRGDFVRAADGRLSRYRGEDQMMIYAGALVIHPRILTDAPQGAFSLNRLFDAAIAAGRMTSVVLSGHWLTVGNPEAIGEAEAAMNRFRRVADSRHG
jgi:N-acetyl-alpha-D-muramate 1-phosphate uridylyltransferase